MNQQNMNRQKQKKKQGWNRLRRRPDDRETTKLYTDQDILSLSHSQNNGSGIMRPNTGDLHMPANLEETRDGQKTNSLPRVLLVIIMLALIFISIISYFVAQMPKKD